MELNYFYISSLILPILGATIGYLYAQKDVKLKEKQLAESNQELEVLKAVRDQKEENDDLADKKFGEFISKIEGKINQVEKDKDILAIEREKFNNERLNRIKNENSKIEYSIGLRGKDNEEELKKLILQKTIYIEDKSVFFNKAMPENSSKRPDVRIHPTDDTMVLIDAKAPMMKFDDYFEAIDEDNQKKISTLKTDLAKHIVKRVDELADKKYSDAKGAFDHVLMFLPTEEHVQVAREATQLIQVNIDQYAFDKKIYISGPRSILRDLEWAEKLLKMRRSYEMERGMLETIKPLFKTIKVMTDHLQEMTRSSNTTIKANDKLNKTFLNSFIKTLDKLSSEGLDDENIDKALNNFKKIENIELETIMEPENQNNIKESKLNS